MTDLKAPQAPHTGSHAFPPMPPASYVLYRDDDSIELRDIVRLFVEQWRLMAIIIFAITALSVAYALSLPRVYRAEALLAPVSLEKSDGVSGLLNQLGDLSALVQRYMGTPKDQTAESIATLRSRTLGMVFIEEQGIKPQLFPDNWDGATQTWRSAEPVPSDLQAYDIFDKQVRHVGIDRRSGLLTLAIEWRDPALAAVWANALVDRVNERRRTEAIREARQSIKYLERQLAETSAIEIRQSLYRLIEAQTKAIALARAREEYAFKVIDPALTPEHPIRPRRRAIALMGLILGTILAVGIVLLRRALSHLRQPTSTG